MFLFLFGFLRPLELAPPPPDTPMYRYFLNYGIQFNSVRIYFISNRNYKNKKQTDITSMIQKINKTKQKQNGKDVCLHLFSINTDTQYT